MVTYYDYNGTQLSTEEVKYEAAATNAETPTRSDTHAEGTYVFKAWVTEQNGSTAANLACVKGTMSVYAAYGIKPYLEAAIINEPWNVAKEVAYTSEVKYSDETQSAKVTAGAGEKYANFRVVANVDSRANAIQFFIKNTTGAALQVYSPFDTDRIISVATSDDWQFVQLLVDNTQAAYTVCVRGAGETIINAEASCFYISNIAFNNDISYKLAPYGDSWTKAKNIAFDTTVTYGEELCSTKVTAAKGGDRAAFKATALTSVNTGYIEFYVKNTTGSRLMMYNEHKAVMIYLEISDEWQYVRMAINADQTEISVIVYGVDANNNTQSINADNDVNYYVSTVKACTVYYSIGETDDVWSKPASLSYVTDVAYAEEAGSMKVGVKVGDVRANLIATATTTEKASYAEFYIKNVTGKELKVYSDYNMVMNYLTVSDEWQLVRFPIDATKNSFPIFVYSKDDTKFSETDVVYYYVSDVKLGDDDYAMSLDESDAWGKAKSIETTLTEKYGTQICSTKVTVTQGYDRAGFLLAPLTTATEYVEFYVKNTTGSRLQLYNNAAGDTKVYLEISNEWQLVRLPSTINENGKLAVVVYGVDADNTMKVINENAESVYYVSNVVNA